MGFREELGVVGGWGLGVGKGKIRGVLSRWGVGAEDFCLVCSACPMLGAAFEAEMDEGAEERQNRSLDSKGSSERSEVLDCDCHLRDRVFCHVIPTNVCATSAMTPTGATSAAKLVEVSTDDQGAPAGLPRHCPRQHGCSLAFRGVPGSQQRPQRPRQHAASPRQRGAPGGRPVREVPHDEFCQVSL